MKLLIYKKKGKFNAFVMHLEVITYDRRLEQYVGDKV